MHLPPGHLVERAKGVVKIGTMSVPTTMMTPTPRAHAGNNDTAQATSDDASHVQVLLHCRILPSHIHARCKMPRRKCRLAADVRPSKLLIGEDGLFAARHIKRGEWIASFGPLQRVDGGLRGRSKRGYSIPITETGSKRLVYVTPIDGVGAMR